MKKATQAIAKDVSTLAEDARVLIDATVDIAGDKIVKARERLTEALDLGMGNFDRVREKAVQGAKVADEVMHEHPYPVIGIGIGLGALIGYLVALRLGSGRN